jgi:parallel beta-helix repeat protein
MEECQMTGRFYKSIQNIAMVFLGVFALTQFAPASTLCVGAKKSGCYSTISDAVAHAAPGDVINVAHGTYHEDVVISKSLWLIGENAANTAIDASGLANAVFINGLTAPGLSNVVIRGFTLTNAKYEGLLIANASNVTVQDNRVTNNDQSLNVANLTCPGLPEFETAEDFDCGEGIHLTGVRQSTISGNTIENNSGGILVSDETGPTHHNLISQNVIRNNLLAHPGI